MKTAHSIYVPQAAAGCSATTGSSTSADGPPSQQWCCCLYSELSSMWPDLSGSCPDLPGFDCLHCCRKYFVPHSLRVAWSLNVFWGAWSSGRTGRKPGRKIGKQIFSRLEQQKVSRLLYCNNRFFHLWFIRFMSRKGSNGDQGMLDFVEDWISGVILH